MGRYLIEGSSLSADVRRYMGALSPEGNGTSCRVTDDRLTDRSRVEVRIVID